MSLRGLPTKPGSGRNAPSSRRRATNNVQQTEVATVVSAPTVNIGTYVAQIAQLEAQIAVLEAEALVDDATIVSLNAQMGSLQSGVASLQSQLDKAFRSVIINVFSTTGGGIYVPPAYDNLTVNYTSIIKLPPTIINTFATTGGGSP